MALTVTTANVRPGVGALSVRVEAGEALAAGELVYVNSDGEAVLADADAAASSILLGIVVGGEGTTEFAEGEMCDVVYSGLVLGFSGMTPGTYAFASTTPGAVEAAAPAGSSGDYVGVLGIILTAVKLLVMPFTYDVAAQ